MSIIFVVVFCHIFIETLIYTEAQLVDFISSFYINGSFFLYFWQSFCPLYLISTRLKTLNNILSLNYSFGTDTIFELVIESINVIELTSQTFAVQLICLRLEIWLLGSFTMFAIFEALVTRETSWQIMAKMMTTFISLDYTGCLLICIAATSISSEVCKQTNEILKSLQVARCHGL